MTLLVLSLVLAAGPEAQHREWVVDGRKREALFYTPTKELDGTGVTPVIFAFHGHGGTAPRSAEVFGIHKLWPEALVVYPQGIPTPSPADRAGKQTGWQRDHGDQKDRDVKFFDAMFETIKKNPKVNLDRVYAMGHSNGGRFTYILWAERPEVFAAFASAAGLMSNPGALKPKPALQIAGEKDPLVKINQQQKLMEAVRKINGCQEDGQNVEKGITRYPSEKGTTFVSLIHPGGHEYPQAVSQVVVTFFKNHKRMPDAAENK